MKKKIALLSTGWSFEYLFSVLRGIQKAIEQDEIDLYLFLCYGYYDEKPAFNKGEYNIFNLVHYEDFDGVILFSNIFNSLEILEREKERVLKSGTPVISLEYLIEGMDYIGTDNYSGMYEIVEHLVKDHGLQDLAYLGGPDDNYESNERERAFRDALTKNGITPYPKRIFRHGDWSYDFASINIELMITQNDLPEGIVCVNDEGAIAALTSLYKNGIRVPDDIKVVGFDNTSSAATFTPSISTVNRNWDKLGARAIEHLKKLMNHLPVEQKEILESSAVKRGSCGCAKELEEQQRNSCMESFYRQKMSLDFGRHLRHLEELFIEVDQPDLLWKDIMQYFTKDHAFEGDSFCFMIERDNVPLDINLDETERLISGYSDELIKIIHIENGISYPKEPFKTRDLIPQSMIEDKNCTYLFVPLHYQDAVLGYFVAKNELTLVENRLCYDWTKGISNGFEKYCQKHVYTLMNEELKELYIRDAMTGLLNRFGYKRLAYDYFARNQEKNRNTGIIFADINSMKGINDYFGHLQGDLAIKTVAEILQRVFPEDWLGIRYGGDEYLVIGTVYNQEQIKMYCDEAVEQLERHVRKMALPYDLSISIGHNVILPDQDITLDEAVKLADETMYRSKTEFHEKKQENTDEDRKNEE